jgi:hypothetical protein
MMNTHAPSSKVLLRNWPVYDDKTLAAAVERLKVRQPTTVTLTIDMKLRTTGEKRDLLRNAQIRVTCMKSEVLELLQRDLTRIVDGTTDTRLVTELINLATEACRTGQTPISTIIGGY